ncbi:MAG TPA: methionyl-tRNA formyltransferase [Chloroflexia bacterium]|nr:methionyl-tRNA formyltransferase [Chloroflexia bacterium]
MSTTAIEPNIVFMGSPEFAVPSMRALAAGPYMLTVVTQPDRPAGRGGKPAPPPVKQAALELGIPILQPETVRDPDFRARLAALHPKATVLVAYGEYLPVSLLDLPERGSINLHPSLLPRWRGSTPVQSAILAGDRTTGVTVIRMDKGLDTGPIIAQQVVEIGPDETQPELSHRLARVGADLLAQILPLWLRGEIEAVPQDDAQSTLTRTLTKEDGLLDWTLSAEELALRVRALQPWPGTYTYWQGNPLKIIRARPLQLDITPMPGKVSIANKGLHVQTGKGTLEILTLQPAGRATMEARAFLAGYPSIGGSVLGR